MPVSVGFGGGAEQKVLMYKISLAPPPHLVVCVCVCGAPLLALVTSSMDLASPMPIADVRYDFTAEFLWTTSGFGPTMILIFQLKAVLAYFFYLHWLLEC